MNRLVITACALFLAGGLLPALELPNFFSDHMVVQRDRPIVIWGTAKPGAGVTVNFKGKTRDTTAGEDGAWRVELPKEKASAGGRDLTVTSGGETRTISDVLVGEVWFASGQSNMAWPVSRTHEADADIARARYPAIRMFLADLTPARDPQSDIGGSWQVCTPENVPRWSAAAYFFALPLHKELGVPVGIIRSAWGGKPVETFTSREALAAIPEGKAMLAGLDAAIADYDPEAAAANHAAALEKWEKRLAAHKERKQAGKEVGRPPRKPALAKDPAVTEGKPGVLYNGMIHPFVGYPMRGAIWYQGESNANHGTAHIYRKLFSTMITDWRKRWDDEFSFLWVQLANFRQPANEPGAVDSWALLQDEQRRTLALPKTGMAVANDIGAADDIHPRNKKEVGRRLALWALKHDYGMDVVAHGPLYKRHTIDGDKVIITFDYAEGLKTRDGGFVQRIEIAGKDRVWHWADAEIKGNTLVVSSPAVPAPVAARYAWCSNPQGANLVNQAGLPASVFRTDDWPHEENSP
ncbi:MAG: sialate O-acetylesterase [Akkermansiaceae bacterium]|nr:sialate O-acetylesterase [Akkermansiaceae bacterium]NNM29943.1 sialate O-acetylesterase [Akkermansiaceae bacterium]